MRRGLATILVGSVLALAMVAPANASIIGVSGATVFLGGDGPAFSAVPDGPGQSDTEIFAWNEKQDFVLGAPLVPDAGAALPAGFMIDSHMLRYDPETFGTATGTVKFANPILSVFFTTPGLDGSDFLGSPGTTYPAPGVVARGLELPTADTLFLIDAYTLGFTWSAGSPGDQLRVITFAVPEPGAMAMLLGGAVVALGLIRRRR